jgi:[acyl-carrier-protein] S-malonyltransferase
MASAWKTNITNAALAFRGYNLTNLGRTAELLNCDAYKPVLLEELRRFSETCSEYTQSPVDLADVVRAGDEPGLAHYAESIALVVAVEVAQTRLLNEIHEVETSQAKFSCGYSLGELAALSFGKTFSVDEMIRLPLAMAADSVKLAGDITMGVLFSRGPLISEVDVERLCLQITSEGKGTLGISAILSPNTYLLIGQQNTVQRFKRIMHGLLPNPAHLRVNNNRWPPLHTPIVRQKNIADRASVMMETLRSGFSPPVPRVLSLVTGEMSYDDHSARDILRKWIDHPQRLWDVVCEILAQGVETVVHIGPEPNVIPATFSRLSDNVLQQTAGSSLGSLGVRAVSGLARRPWLAALLPEQATLLRAPYIKHVVLEDWLIDNAP